MKSLGGLLMMVGLGQTLFQAHTWARSGHWLNYTNGDLLAEIGIGMGLRLGRAEPLRDAVLQAEMSLTLMVIGAVVVLTGPLRRLYEQWHAGRALTENRRRLEARRAADPLATLH